MAHVLYTVQQAAEMIGATAMQVLDVVATKQVRVAIRSRSTVRLSRDEVELIRKHLGKPPGSANQTPKASVH